jgi:hypothetical protein
VNTHPYLPYKRDPITLLPITILTSGTEKPHIAIPFSFGKKKKKKEPH